jgi:DNA primase
MGVSQDNAARRVKEAADIIEVIGEHVTLQKAGVRYKGLCPFHTEKTPSFTVDRDRQFYHCFGCNESGDVLSFVMKYHNMTFPDALAKLAERYGVALEESGPSPEALQKAREREALYAVNRTAAALFHEFLLHNPAAGKARQYLEKRGMPREIISRFQLGYAPERWDFLARGLAEAGAEQQMAVAAGLLVQKDAGGVYDRFRDRIIFPIFSATGQVAGFGGRILGEGQPKYLNSPETPIFNKSQTLFGLYQNKAAIRAAGRCLLVEGNFDLLSLVKHGLQHVVAPLGTALTAQQVRIIKRHAAEAVVIFDGDQAGLKAALRAVPLFLTEQLDARIVILPGEHDPDTFVSAFGSQALEEKVAGAMELAEFVFDRLVREHGLSLAGKGRIVRELQPVIAAIGNRKLQKTLFVSHFSDKLGLRPEELLAGEDRSADLPPARQVKQGKPAGQGIKLSRNYRQLLEFLLLYPEALPHFLAAGLEELADNEHAGAMHILARLKDLGLQGQGAERLLELLEGEEKSLVARLLLEAPSYSDEMKETMVAEMTAWVGKKAWQGRKARLLHLIHEAQAAGNEALLMELLEKKKEMDEVSYT